MHMSHAFADERGPIRHHHYSMVSSGGATERSGQKSWKPKQIPPPFSVTGRPGLAGVGVCETVVWQSYSPREKRRRAKLSLIL